LGQVICPSTLGTHQHIHVDSAATFFLNVTFTPHRYWSLCSFIFQSPSLAIVYCTSIYVQQGVHPTHNVYWACSGFMWIHIESAFKLYRHFLCDPPPPYEKAVPPCAVCALDTFSLSPQIETKDCVGSTAGCQVIMNRRSNTQGFQPGTSHVHYMVLPHWYLPLIRPLTQPWHWLLFSTLTLCHLSLHILSCLLFCYT